MNQLDRIMEVTGRPAQEDIDAINSPFAATMLDNLPGAEARRLHEMFPNASPVRQEPLIQRPCSESLHTNVCPDGVACPPPPTLVTVSAGCGRSDEEAFAL